jgi:hypothetical protein
MLDQRAADHAHRPQQTDQDSSSRPALRWVDGRSNAAASVEAKYQNLFINGFDFD